MSLFLLLGSNRKCSLPLLFPTNAHTKQQSLLAFFLTAGRFEILQGVMGQEGAATVSWQSLAARL